MFPLQPSDFELAPPTIALLIIVAAMLQDDLTCMAVGLFASDGSLPLPIAWGSCFVGTLLGDLIWFMLARSLGTPLFSRLPLSRLINPSQLECARALVERFGTHSIFICRFLPGLRTILQIVIGTLHQNVFRAVSVFALAAFVYTLMIVGVCRAFRNSIGTLKLFQDFQVPALLMGGILVLVLLCLARRTLTQLVDTESSADAKK